MGRKKKVPVEAEEDIDGFKFEDILESDAKRSIAAVFLFSLSILFLLAYFNTAGILGEWLDAGLGMLLGWGKWLLPILLLIAALLFLKRRTTTLADAVRFIGLTIAFFSVLGLLHLYSGDTTKELLKVARAGEGGGFIGFGLAYLLGNFTGKAAGTLISVALFATGIIAAFNMSLIHSFERLQERLRRKPEEETVSDEVAAEDQTPVVTEQASGSVPAETEETDAPLVVPMPQEADALEAHNIRNLQFHDEEVEQPLDEEEVDEASDEEDYPRESRPRASRRAAIPRWVLPSIELTESPTNQVAAGGDTERNKQVIQSMFKNFGIIVEPGDVRVGPTVTQYTFRPASGVKLSRITALSNDLALELAAQSIRIEAPIPGQSFIGIEIPNTSVAIVRLRTFLESKEFRERKSNLMLVLGQDVAGKYILGDLRKMPHLLIAGRTGSGKSVCINTLLLSLLYQNSPEDLKLILVDPKRVELSAYKGIPHLKTDVIMDNKKVVNVLKWAVGEMERRYKLLEEVHTRDLALYREKCARGDLKTIVDSDTGKVRKEELEPLPYIVIVIDEMADLMAAHGKEVEAVVIRLAQMSRAIGIHLILATQRPSVEILTGTIKANIPTRIAFQVTTQIDSRTILDSGGAEKLLGNGDMLYSPSEGTEIKRLQGVYASDDEVRRVTGFLRDQKEELGEEDGIGEDLTGLNAGQSSITEALDAMDEGSKEDDMYEEAKRLIVKTGKASTTSLQTAFSIGYPRAARLMHLFEENGVVGMVDGKKKVLLSQAEDTEEIPSDEKKYGDDALSDQNERDKWQL